jgi:hypothetical protein
MPIVEEQTAALIDAFAADGRAELRRGLAGRSRLESSRGSAVRC